MRIAVPTDGEGGLNCLVAVHFGRCPTYTFLDGDGSLVEVVANTSEHMGGSGMPPELLKKHGADALLCRDLGPRALAMCGELGIGVYLCGAETVKGMFEAWKRGKAKKAGSGDVCGEHRA